MQWIERKTMEGIKTILSVCAIVLIGSLTLTACVIILVTGLRLFGILPVQ